MQILSPGRVGCLRATTAHISVSSRRLGAQPTQHAAAPAPRRQKRLGRGGYAGARTHGSSISRACSAMLRSGSGRIRAPP
eukprot:COSAG01_NODE_5244_length_4388_cov_6.643740_3_plen_80_part_00